MLKSTPRHRVYPCQSEQHLHTSLPFQLSAGLQDFQAFALLGPSSFLLTCIKHQSRKQSTLACTEAALGCSDRVRALKGYDSRGTIGVDRPQWDPLHCCPQDQQRVWNALLAQEMEENSIAFEVEGSAHHCFGVQCSAMHREQYGVRTFPNLPHSAIAWVKNGLTDRKAWKRLSASALSSCVQK